MTLPNFLVIGAQKSGTTALYNYLRQHPQVYMSPEKEPHFFTYEGGTPVFTGLGRGWVNPITNIEEYKKLFQGVSQETAIGEVSPSYLYFEKARERIKYHIPGAKIIAVLRDPADRAYSNFLHSVRTGREPLEDFDRALDEEEARICDNWGPLWHYRRKGFYYEQLKGYYEAFGRDRIKVYLYEDLSADPVAVSQDIFRFLGVDDAFVPDTSGRYNVSGVPRNEALNVAFKKLNRITPVVRRYIPSKLGRYIKSKVLVRPPQLPSESRRRLVADYREDILELQDLIGRDLSEWLE